MKLETISKIRSLHFLAVLIGSAMVYWVDMASKYWALHHLQLAELDLLPVLQLRLAYNRGAAFSLLHQAGGWQIIFFVVLAVLTVLALYYGMWRCERVDKLLMLANSLAIGGILGNLHDRLMYGYVIDFIDLYWKNHHWPTFNVADAAICIGFGLLMVYFYRQDFPDCGKR